MFRFAASSTEALLLVEGSNICTLSPSFTDNFFATPAPIMIPFSTDGIAKLLVLFIVLVLVIAVASFNIVSTLIMAVNDKKGDIAILKTMGASRKLIMLTFIYQGLVNGLLGSIIGGVLGVFLALNLADIVAFVESLFALKLLSADVYFIDHIPSLLNMSDVYVTVITALVMSLLATIYPAWRATKIEPAQVLGQL